MVSPKMGKGRGPTDSLEGCAAQPAHLVPQSRMVKGLVWRQTTGQHEGHEKRGARHPRNCASLV